MPHTETIKNTQVNEFIKTYEKDNLLSVRRNIILFGSKNGGDPKYNKSNIRAIILFG